MTDFSLDGSERVKLEHLLEQTRDARLLLRVYALLWLDDGDSIAEVAARLSVTRQTVYNWASRFQLRATPELNTRLGDSPRGGRPRTATAVTVEELIASVIERDPRELEYRSTVWTAPLLAQYVWDEQQLTISSDSVRRIIARLRIRWKRPRHSLALRPVTWRQAKGG
jgi:transposase